MLQIAARHEHTSAILEHDKNNSRSGVSEDCSSKSTTPRAGRARGPDRRRRPKTAQLLYRTRCINHHPLTCSKKVPFQLLFLSVEGVVLDNVFNFCYL